MICQINSYWDGRIEGICDCGAIFPIDKIPISCPKCQAKLSQEDFQSFWGNGEVFVTNSFSEVE